MICFDWNDEPQGINVDGSYDEGEQNDDEEITEAASGRSARNGYLQKSQTARHHQRIPPDRPRRDRSPDHLIQTLPRRPLGAIFWALCTLLGAFLLLPTFTESTTFSTFRTEFKTVSWVWGLNKGVASQGSHGPQGWLSSSAPLTSPQPSSASHSPSSIFHLDNILAGLASLTPTPPISTFYLGAILIWISPVIALLTYLGAYISIPFDISFSSSFPLSISGNDNRRSQTSKKHRRKGDLVALIIGVGWLWMTDTIAIRSGSWKIESGQTGRSTGWEIWRGLPFEEALFFFLTSYLIIISCSLISHLHLLLFLAPRRKILTSSSSSPSDCLDSDPGSRRSFAALPPSRCPPKSFLLHVSLLLSLALSPPPLPSNLLTSLSLSHELLKKHSKSFDAASMAFGREVRVGLLAVYGWCRVTDDLVDDEPAPDPDSEGSDGEIEGESDEGACERAREGGDGQSWQIGTEDLGEDREDKTCDAEEENEKGQLLKKKVERVFLMKEFLNFVYRTAAPVPTLGHNSKKSTSRSLITTDLAEDGTTLPRRAEEETEVAQTQTQGFDFHRLPANARPAFQLFWLLDLASLIPRHRAHGEGEAVKAGEGEMTGAFDDLVEGYEVDLKFPPKGLASEQSERVAQEKTTAERERADRESEDEAPFMNEVEQSNSTNVQQHTKSETGNSKHSRSFRLPLPLPSPILTESDLLDYADKVAGSVAEMICWVCWGVLEGPGDGKTSREGVHDHGDGDVVVDGEGSEEELRSAQGTGTGTGNVNGNGQTYSSASQVTPTPTPIIFPEPTISEEKGHILSSARRMGQSLQLVNIARDIRQDAEEMGRCYIPLSVFEGFSLMSSLDVSGGSWDSAHGIMVQKDGTKKNMSKKYGGNQDSQSIFNFTAPFSDLESLLCSAPSSSSAYGSICSRSPSPLDTTPYSSALVTYANSLRASSGPAIGKLPYASRAGMRAMVASYFEIASAMEAAARMQDEREEGVKQEQEQELELELEQEQVTRSTAKRSVKKERNGHLETQEIENGHVRGQAKTRPPQPQPPPPPPSHRIRVSARKRMWAVVKAIWWGG